MSKHEVQAGARYIFRTVDDVSRFGAGMLQFLAKSVKERGAQWVRLEDYSEKRSLPQSALQFVWYGEIERAGLMTRREARRYCKLHFGVPILRCSETEEGMRFRSVWDRSILHRFTYEEKSEMMDIMPVTSLMTPDEMSQYLDDMQRNFSKEGVQLVSHRDA